MSNFFTYEERLELQKYLKKSLSFILMHACLMSGTLIFPEKLSFVSDTKSLNLK